MIGAGITVTLQAGGSIAGGTNNGASPQGDAIDFTGGNNALTLSQGGAPGMLTGDVAVGGTLTVDSGTAAGSAVTLANAIKDYADPTGAMAAGALVKAGTGTLVLTGTNTYTGGTALNSGVLDLAAQGASGSAAITFGGAAPAALRIESAAIPFGTFASPVANFGAGDAVDLTNLTYVGTGTGATTVAYDGTKHTLTVTSDGFTDTLTNFMVASGVDPTSIGIQSDDGTPGGTLVYIAGAAPAFTAPANGADTRTAEPSPARAWPVTR